jgi:hypothetical protein
VGRSLLEAITAVNRRGPDVKLELYAESGAWWLKRGLEVFRAVHDPNNVALLHLNLACLYKCRSQWSEAPEVRTSAVPFGLVCLSTQESVRRGPVQTMQWLDKATKECRSAHEVLEERGADPQIWDAVSEVSAR